MNMSLINNYLASRSEIMMDFLFGSVAADSAGSESDIDIAVYYDPPNKIIEYETQTQYPAEDRIWFDLERLTGREVDLLVLNRAPVTIVDTVLREGKPLFIRDRKIYLDLLLRTSREAEDYRDFIEDFWKIKSRNLFDQN